MTPADARMVERAIAEVIKRFRANEIEPLRRQIEALSRDLALDRRLADIEARLGTGAEPELPKGNVARLRGAR